MYANLCQYFTSFSTTTLLLKANLFWLRHEWKRRLLEWFEWYLSNNHSCQCLPYFYFFRNSFFKSLREIFAKAMTLNMIQKPQQVWKQAQSLLISNRNLNVGTMNQCGYAVSKWHSSWLTSFEIGEKQKQMLQTTPPCAAQTQETLCMSCFGCKTILHRLMRPM